MIGSVSPADDDSVADALIDRFKLSGSAADALREAVADPPHSGLSVLGALLLVISALSFTRAMQRGVLVDPAGDRRPVRRHRGGRGDAGRITPSG